MKLHPFVRGLTCLQMPHTFNPYSDRCPTHDRPDAPAKRAKLLSDVLNRATRVQVDAIWVGRDLGYRGGRRTGLALTDDVHVSAHAKRWGLVAERATRSECVAERTASVIWGVLACIDQNVFLWNVFPLHPHEPDLPFTNRQHNRREASAGEAVLSDLLNLLRPRRIVAIGNDAAASVNRVAGLVSSERVRHPSYGGQSTFLRQIESLYLPRRPWALSAQLF